VRERVTERKSANRTRTVIFRPARDFAPSLARVRSAKGRFEDRIGRHAVRVCAAVSGAYSRPAFAMTMDMCHDARTATFDSAPVPANAKNQAMTHKSGLVSQ
jgi:hypothetical protein